MRPSGELVVERIKVTVLSAPINDAVPMSFAQLDRRQVCLVEVEAAGVVGVGESWINYPAWAAEERVATLIDGVAPLLIGMDASDPAAVQQRLHHQLAPIARQAGAPGPLWQALSGVDLALWDLVGKARGVPVARMLGADADMPLGSTPAYASGVGPNHVVRLCETALAAGLDTVKVKLGFGDDTDVATLAAARAVLGDGRQIFADANQAWTLEDAVHAGHLLREYTVGWLEEPLAGDDLTELEKLAADVPTPLATGENLYGLATFTRYADSPAVAVLQPDLAKSGGLSVGRRVAAYAGASDTVIAPHCYGGAVALAASIQLGAAFDSVRWIELDIRDNPLRTELLTTPLKLDGSHPVVPAGPGLGIELDPEILTRFRTHEKARTHHDF